MRKRFSSVLGCLAVSAALLPQIGRGQPGTSPTAKADLFPARSVWVDESGVLTLTVLERKGETFRGRLVAGDMVERTFTGTVRDGKVAWLAKDVRAAKGGQGGDNTGAIRADQIDFEYRTDDGKGTFTLRRSDAPESKPDPPPPDMIDFRLTITITGQPREEIRDVRSALARLDKWIAEPGQARQFAATVQVSKNEKTFKTPKGARRGVELMLLAALDAVGRCYGIAIVASEVRTATAGFSLHTKPPQKDDVLIFGIEAMRFLSGYTPEAIRRMELKRIVLCDEATLNGQPFPSGGGALQDSLVLGIKGIGPELVVRLHHELYHVFDVASLGPRAATDAEWSALNPQGFSYRGLGDFFGPDGQPRPAFANPPPEGFVTVYATASASEDKAETYFAMLARPEWLAEAMTKVRHIRAKVELIESRLRGLGPEFKAGFWRKS